MTQPLAALRERRDWLDFRDRVVVVTGAGQGIGLAIARMFLDHGAFVVAHVKDDAPSCLQEDARCLLVHGDLQDQTLAPALIRRCQELAGAPDVLVNNAGVYPRIDVMDLRVEDWEHVMRVNVRAALQCMQEAGRVMMKRGAGAIINVASDAHLKGPPRGGHYAASKAGLVALTRSFARRLAPHGVRVNAIAPGLIDTAQPNLSEIERAEKAREVPLGRVGDPSDVAKVALYLASPLSDYVTGQTMFVNGGALLGV